MHAFSKCSIFIAYHLIKPSNGFLGNIIFWIETVTPQISLVNYISFTSSSAAPLQLRNQCSILDSLTKFVIIHKQLKIIKFLPLILMLYFAREQFWELFKLYAFLCTPFVSVRRVPFVLFSFCVIFRKDSL